MTKLNTMGTATLVVAALSGAADASDKFRYKPISVATPDGLTISAQEWGNPDGPEIVFIHGFAQSHLSWSRQFDSELAKEFRLISYDLRGHGNSDKPNEPARYKDSIAWANELHAVMDAAKLKRPVLVAWSYGGRVVGDYLLSHGASRLAGINFVDATTKTDASFFGDGLKPQALMGSEDLQTSIAATRQFLRNCFVKQPSNDEFEAMLAFNMMVPAKVRSYLGGRAMIMDQKWKELDLPVLVTHGSEDRLVLPGMARYTANTIPRARLSIYDGIGHTPFYEDAVRFNSELATFVRAANKLK